MEPILSSDRALARRIEELEAAGAWKAARCMGANVAGESHLGGCALFGGVDSPMTLALGIGMQGPASEREFDAMERFFFDRSCPVMIDLCPLADESVQEFVRSRGYTIIEFNNVMARRLGPDLPGSAGIEIRRVEPAGKAAWGRLIIEGFSEVQPVAEDAAVVLIDSCRDYECFLALVDGRPAGGGAMNIHDGAVALFGAASLKPYRALGIQQALIAHRSRLAREAGCDLAVACVIPGSGSHRNYERAGFRLAYMRVNVVRPRT
jgi:GNAT superfamily N-acetyltransferase